MSSPSAVLAVLQAAADAAAATSQVGGAVVSVRAALDSPLWSIAGREISVAAGWADTHREAMTTTSQLCWGSCTKTVTAAAVMRAVEAGLLALDDLVAPLIDPLIAASPPMAAGGSLAELFGEGHAGITIRQLLQMRTGIADFEHEGLAADGRTSYEVWWAGDQHGVWSPIEQLAWASVKHRRPPHFLPDEGGAYTSTNYTLLGLVLQAVHNLPRWEDVEALLLETLPEESRATTNFPSVGTYKTNGAVHGYSSDPEHPDMHDEYSLGAAWTAGNIVSTAADMSAWVHALFCEDGRVVSAASLAQMTEMRVDPESGFVYGLGLRDVPKQIPTAAALDAIGHDGGIAGFSSTIMYIPAWRLCLAASVNDAYPSAGKESLKSDLTEAVLAGLKASAEAAPASAL